MSRDFAARITAAQEAEARKWLDYLARDPKHIAATILALLARPTLPEEPSNEAIDAMCRAEGCYGRIYTEHWKNAYAALYAHLTRPKTKTVWRIKGVNRDFPTRIDALNAACGLDEGPITIEPVEVET